ncbi:MAG: RluA family pseudouridine synthase [Planctomycetes bacterium]|nr:RluA family pseudouridine synthase [Planctomycetota bacterium]
MSPEPLRVEIPEAARGRRFDLALLELVGELSRTRLQALIQAGRVRFRGEVVTKPGLLLLEGGPAELELDPATAADPECATRLVPLHVDESLVVVDKPAGLLTHANRPGGEPGAAEIAARTWGPFPSSEEPDRRPGVVHRLDRETSGVLVLARTSAALEALQSAFRERAVAKTYLALVHGEPRFDSEWIDARLGRSEQHPDRISVVRGEEGREALTYYEIRERFRGFALAAVFPKTGRTHQVRVHMAYARLHLLGDPLYRPSRRQLEGLPEGAPPVGRTLLHAAALEFAHPATGATVRYEAALPADFAAVLDWLRAHRPEPAA